MRDLNDLAHYSGHGTEDDLGVGRGPHGAFGPGPAAAAHTGQPQAYNRDAFSTFSGTGAIIPGQRHAKYIGSIPPAVFQSMGVRYKIAVDPRTGEQFLVPIGAGLR